MDQDGLGTEVGLGPGHSVLDGDPATRPVSRRRNNNNNDNEHICIAQNKNPQMR